MDAQDRLFGEIAVRLQLLTREQVAGCIHAQSDTGTKLGETALALGLLSADQVEVVLAHQARVLERRREARSASRPLVAHEEGASAHDRRSEVTAPAPTSKPIAPASKPAAARLSSGKPADKPRKLGDRSSYDDIADAPSEAREPGPHAIPKLVVEKAQSLPLDEELPPVIGRRSPSRDLIRTIQGITRESLETHDALALADATGDARTGGAPTELAPAAQQQGAAPEYDLDAPDAVSGEREPGQRRSNTGTMLGGAALVAEPAPKRASHTGTLVQPFGDAPAPRPAPRAPADRSWRNPTEPPDEVPPGALGRGATEPAPAAAPGTRATLVSSPAPQPFSADKRDARSAPTTLAQPRVLSASLPVPSERGYLDRLLALVFRAGASDLHVHAGQPPFSRVDGVLSPVPGAAPLLAATTEQIIAESMSETQWQTLLQRGEVRFAYDLEGVARIRVHAYRHASGLAAACRLLPMQAPTLDALGLPLRLGKLVAATRGLGLCTGPLGAGKSATLCALVAELGRQRAAHIVSIEAPVEYSHAQGPGLVEQHEVPTHAPTLTDGITHALRKGAEVIVVSDLPDAVTIGAAVRAAESGALVLACLRASSAQDALTRMSSALPPLGRAALARALRFVLHQKLLRQAIGQGRVPALEILLATPQVSQLLRENKLSQLQPVMAAGAAAGMVTFDQALSELASTGAISEAQARNAVQRKERWKAT